MSLFTELASVLAQTGTAHFRERLGQMEYVRNAWRDGKDIVLLTDDFAEPATDLDPPRSSSWFSSDTSTPTASTHRGLHRRSAVIPVYQQTSTVLQTWQVSDGVVALLKKC